MTQKEIFKLKDNLQNKIVDMCLEKTKNLVALCTGGGKTRVGILYCLKKEFEELKILWVVPRRKLRDNTVEEEFIKWGHKEFYDKHVETVCYASLANIIDTHNHIVIFDEGHWITEANSIFFDQNSFNELLVLTATPPHETQKRQLLANLGIFSPTYFLSLDEGVEMGIVAPYEIVVVTTELDEKNKYIRGGSKNSPFLTTEGKQYRYLCRQIHDLQDIIDQSEDWRKVAKAKKSKFYKTLERMRFIYNLRSKTLAAKKVVDSLPPTDRSLFFCGSIDQCIELSEYRFFSKKYAKKTDSDIKKAQIKEQMRHYKGDKDYKKFCSGEISQLAVVKMVNEGENIKLLDSAVAAQLTSNPRSTIQRIGRLVRIRKGHKAQIYVMCVTGTQDEVWVENALQDLDNINISYKTLNEFLNEKTKDKIPA